jgi:hypothetical protein
MSNCINCTKMSVRSGGDVAGYLGRSASVDSEVLR